MKFISFKFSVFNLESHTLTMMSALLETVLKVFNWHCSQFVCSQQLPNVYHGASYGTVVEKQNSFSQKLNQSGVGSNDDEEMTLQSLELQMQFSVITRAPLFCWLETVLSLCKVNNQRIRSTDNRMMLWYSWLLFLHVGLRGDNNI